MNAITLVHRYNVTALSNGVRMELEIVASKLVGHRKTNPIYSYLRVESWKEKLPLAVDGNWHKDPLSQLDNVKKVRDWSRNVSSSNLSLQDSGSKAEEEAERV